MDPRRLPDLLWAWSFGTSRFFPHDDLLPAPNTLNDIVISRTLEPRLVCRVILCSKLLLVLITSFPLWSDFVSRTVFLFFLWKSDFQLVILSFLILSFFLVQSWHIVLTRNVLVAFSFRRSIEVQVSEPNYCHEPALFHFGRKKTKIFKVTQQNKRIALGLLEALVYVYMTDY